LLLLQGPGSPWVSGSWPGSTRAPCMQHHGCGGQCVPSICRENRVGVQVLRYRAAHGLMRDASRLSRWWHVPVPGWWWAHGRPPEQRLRACFMAMRPEVLGSLYNRCQCACQHSAQLERCLVASSWRNRSAWLIHYAGSACMHACLPAHRYHQLLACHCPADGPTLIVYPLDGCLSL
jgi:hypothetical protein